MAPLFSRWKGRSPGFRAEGERSRTGRRRRVLSLEMMEARTLLTGTITPLVNAVPNDAGSGTMLLETNGDVMMVSGGDSTSNSYYVLKPDASGNYVDGTWTQTASAKLDRLFNGSTILHDGRLMIMGGEYAGPNNKDAFTGEGEIYDPTTNTWTTTAPYPTGTFGDDTLVTLSDGTVMGSYVGGPQNYIYNPANNTWTQTGTKLNNDQNDEETFVKLPDGGIVTYAIFSSVNDGKGEAQRWSPTTGKWTSTGPVPVALSDTTSGYEMGAGLLLPDGRVFQIGATGNTAYYTPSSNTWTAGPAIPGGLVQDDAPAAELPNGKIILTADVVGYNGPTHVFEYDPVAQSYTDISSSFPSGFLSSPFGGPAFLDRMLVLPSGQVLINNSDSKLVLYTPDSGSLASNIPTIGSIAQNANGSFTLTGTGIDGNSDGASYGDDAQMSTDYPIVSFTNSSGVVSYATTFGFNGQVQQGSTPLTTQFTLPVGLPAGAYAVRVIANGAASSPHQLTVPTKAGDTPSIVTRATATPNPVTTTSAQLSALGGDTAGESTLTYNWTTVSSPAGLQTPTYSTNDSNAAKADKVTFYGVGAYTFQVTATNLAGLSVSSTVTVSVVPNLTSLALAPTVVQLSPNQTQQFSVAAGLDQFGNQITTSSLSWTLVSGGGTLTASGLYTAPQAGTIATVRVAAGNVNETALIYVLSNPWVESDVGSPSLAGHAADNGSGVFTLIGGGTGIAGGSDQAQFAYLSLPGNNSAIEAQVATVGNADRTSEAGIAYRTDTSTGAANVTLAITPNNGLVYSYRVAANGNTVTTTLPRVIPGDYLKVVRNGNIYTGYYSLNGTTWIQVGSPANVAMGNAPDGGMIVSSGTAAATSTSTFNHVLADASPNIVTAASASPNPVTTTSTTLSVLGGDPAGESALSYTWTVTSSPAGAVTPTFATNGTNASKSDKVTFHKAGLYSFSVLVSNALGYSTTSSTNVTVVATQTTVGLTPTTATLVEGQSLQFTAAVYDQFGLRMTIQPRFTFSIIAGGAGGTVSSQGVYTAPGHKTGRDIVNVTSPGTAATATVTVIAPPPGPGVAPTTTTNNQGATVGQVVAGWGADASSLVTAPDGLRLLPIGRRVDIPWANLDTLTVALSKAVPLTASEVKVTGITTANYGPVTVSLLPGTASTYLITLARPISQADRVTLTIGGTGIASYTRRLDVLPGDVNDDGIVNQADATIAAGYLLSLDLPADVSGTGAITTQTVKKIQLLNGTTLPSLT